MNKTIKKLDSVTLLPCPSCGGKVIESVNKAGNLSKAVCTNCNKTWGECSSVFKDRFKFWNERP